MPPEDAINKDGQQGLQVSRDSLGRILPGRSLNPHGRIPGSKNKKTPLDARAYMAKAAYDSIKALHEMLTDSIDDELKFKIHVFLAKFQYTDPDKEVEPIDVEPVTASGQLTLDFEAEQRIKELDGN